MRYFFKSSWELLTNQPERSTASGGGSGGVRAWLTTTFERGRKLLWAGETVVVKLTRLVEPSGKRPWETPVCCAPNVTEVISVPSGENRATDSPDLLSLKLTWSGPAPGWLSAKNCTKLLPPAPMNESGGMGESVFSVRVSVKNKPPRETGWVPLLNSSNQSLPVAGSAIHSLTMRLEASPRPAAVLGVSGLGTVRVQTREPLGTRPMETSGVWRP